VCETWSLIPREILIHGLRVFGNRVLRRQFGLKREEVAGGWKRLHNLYASPNIIRVIKSRKMKWAWHVAHIGKIRVHTKF
jgi:hypothetical protein